MPDGQNIEITFHRNIADVEEAWHSISRKAAENIRAGKIPYFLCSFYQSYEWNAFLDATYRRSPFRYPLYVLAASGSEPKAVIPLLVCRDSRKLELLSGKVAGILNAAVSGGDDLPGIIASALRGIVERYSGYRLKFKDVPAASAMSLAMSESGHDSAERGSYHIPIGDFESHEKYVGSLSRSTRTNINNAYNRMKSDGKSFRIRVFGKDNPPGPLELLAAWRIYFNRKLEWKHLEKSPLRRTVAFLRAAGCMWRHRISRALRKLPQSRLVLLDIDSRPVAMAFYFVDGQNILVPKLAIDRSVSRYSPGFVLILELMKKLREEGIADIDLCRGEEPYKLRLGGINQPLHSFLK